MSSISRLTEIGLSQRSPDTPIDVPLTSVYWGWQAHPITVSYEKPAVSRLAHWGVSIVADKPTVGELITLGSGNWGWKAYNLAVDYSDPQLVDLTKQDWGWEPKDLTVCSQSNFGYEGSFNDAVWPTCAFNEYVFGPRTHLNLRLDRNDWGWQPQPVIVSFEDPIDVDLTQEDWGWRAHPVAVSYSFDIQLAVSPWGWQPQPVSVELVHDIDLARADWGWRSHPVGVSFGTDIGVQTATWGWQGLPLDVQAPAHEVFLRKADWGWQSLPMQVRQTQLLPGDIEAIADAVYQKFVDEGVVQCMIETWQRLACDPAHSQTIRHPDNGGNIEVAGMTIEQQETPEGDVVQTRQ